MCCLKTLRPSQERGFSLTLLQPLFWQIWMDFFPEHSRPQLKQKKVLFSKSLPRLPCKPPLTIPEVSTVTKVSPQKAGYFCSASLRARAFFHVPSLQVPGGSRDKIQSCQPLTLKRGDGHVLIFSPGPPQLIPSTVDLWFGLSLRQGPDMFSRLLVNS